MKPVLILGLGNPLQRDDGVGCRVAEALERQVLPEGIEVLDGGTPGLGLVHLLEGRQRVLIVDAADMGEPPGTLRLFHYQALNAAEPATQFSLHRAGVLDAFALARALNLPLGDIVFVGVQPAQVGWGEELDPAVEAALPLVIAEVLREAGVDDGKTKDSNH